MQLSPGAGALQTDASLPGLCRRPTRAHGPTPLSARRVGIPANVSLLDGRIQRAGRGSAWALGWRWRRRRGTPWSLAWSGTGWPGTTGSGRAPFAPGVRGGWGGSPSHAEPLWTCLLSQAAWLQSVCPDMGALSPALLASGKLGRCGDASLRSGLWGTEPRTEWRTLFLQNPQGVRGASGVAALFECAGV